MMSRLIIFTPAILGLYIAAIEDKKKLVVGETTILYLATVTLILYLSGNIYVDTTKIAILIALIILNLCGFIGGGDAKIMMLMALIIPPSWSMLAVCCSLATLYLYRKRERRRVPLISLYTIWLTLLILLDSTICIY